MITLTYRTFDKSIKSLLHFDYPYFAEPFDGLGDNILGNVWTRKGSIKLVGSSSPADAIVSGTPKFGYRCLQSSGSSDYITCSSSAFSLTSSDNYEILFWIRPTASQAGTIINFLNGSNTVLAVSLDASLHVMLNSGSISLTSSNTLTLNSWALCSVRLSGSQASLIVNNVTTSKDITRSAITVTECRLGGFAGQLDEFMFSSRILSSLPTQPAQGILNITDIGGPGSGIHGNVTITSNCIMNTTAAMSAVKGSMITGIPSGYSFGNVQTGKFGTVAVGQEVMILNENGEYCFSTISSVSSSNISFNPKPSITGPTSFIVIPNFYNLTINAGVTVSPHAWNGTSGGIVAFRVKGNCTINGSIITMGKGKPRSDNLQLTHGSLIDNFITNKGGGIFIVCGGTLTAPSTARLGAAWSGAGTGGTSAYRADGSPGGAGYGGAGGSDTDTNCWGGNGGVGGGGGGCDGYSGDTVKKAGNEAGISFDGSSTGGGFKTYAGSDTTGRQGGTQGITSGAKGINGGGGGAGGIGTGSTGLTASSGANIVIITKTLNVDAAAVSTGGAGGSKENSGYQCGGGGTGFCYIACKEVK